MDMTFQQYNAAFAAARQLAKTGANDQLILNALGSAAEYHPDRAKVILALAADYRKGIRPAKKAKNESSAPHADYLRTIAGGR